MFVGRLRDTHASDVCWHLTALWSSSMHTRLAMSVRSVQLPPSWRETTGSAAFASAELVIMRTRAEKAVRVSVCEYILLPSHSANPANANLFDSRLKQHTCDVVWLSTVLVIFSHTAQELPREQNITDHDARHPSDCKFSYWES